MANFWEDLKKNITEWSIVASEKAEEFTHTSKLRIDVLQLERKLSSHYVKLGLYVFSKTKEKNVLNFVGDKKYLSIVDSVESIKSEIADIKKEINQKYKLNAYRVLLTRARQGMIIVVPEGDPIDKTRNSSYYDPTWNYLKEIGLEVI